MRLTTDAELAALARPPEQHALDALRRGERDRVRALLQTMRLGPAGLDALSGHTLARKAGKLRQDLGEAGALQALRRVGAALMAGWAEQLGRGDERGAFADLLAVLREPFAARVEALDETDAALVVELAPCGSGGRLEQQGLPARHPQAYGGWSDGVSSYCQICKACQHALNDAVGAETWTTEKGEQGRCRVSFHKHATRGQRLFDADERQALARKRIDVAIERFDAGDDTIEPLLDGQRLDWKPWHDFGVVMLAHVYAVALEVGGADYLDELLMQTYAPAFDAGFPRYRAMGDVERVREIALTWHYHCASFTISEEEDRFVFRLDPCGSGGRMFRGAMWRDLFRYGRPLSPLMAEPHPINFMRRQAPVYCTHCAASNRTQLAKAADPATPLFFVIDGQRQQQPGAPCACFVYKQDAPRARIDPALFRQIGLVPPLAEGAA